MSQHVDPVLFCPQDQSSWMYTSQDIYSVLIRVVDSELNIRVPNNNTATFMCFIDKTFLIFWSFDIASMIHSFSFDYILVMFCSEIENSISKLHFYYLFFLLRMHQMHKFEQRGKSVLKCGQKIWSNPCPWNLQMLWEFACTVPQSVNSFRNKTDQSCHPFPSHIEARGKSPAFGEYLNGLLSRSCWSQLMSGSVRCVSSFLISHFPSTFPTLPVLVQ